MSLINQLLKTSLESVNLEKTEELSEIELLETQQQLEKDNDSFQNMIQSVEALLSLNSVPDSLFKSISLESIGLEDDKPSIIARIIAFIKHIWKKIVSFFSNIVFKSKALYYRLTKNTEALKRLKLDRLKVRFIIDSERSKFTDDDDDLKNNVFNVYVGHTYPIRPVDITSIVSGTREGSEEIIKDIKKLFDAACKKLTEVTQHGKNLDAKTFLNKTGQAEAEEFNKATKLTINRLEVNIKNLSRINYDSAEIKEINSDGLISLGKAYSDALSVIKDNSLVMTIEHELIKMSGQLEAIERNRNGKVLVGYNEIEFLCSRLITTMNKLSMQYANNIKYICTLSNQMNSTIEKVLAHSSK